MADLALLEFILAAITRNATGDRASSAQAADQMSTRHHARAVTVSAATPGCSRLVLGRRFPEPAGSSDVPA